MAERKTQYTKGFDDAIEGVIHILTAAKLAYPAMPEVEDLQIFMPPEVALTVLTHVARYQQKVTDDINKRIEEVASAQA